MNKKQELIDNLELLRKQEIANKEPWKAKSYNTVITNLKNTNIPIYSYEDLKDIKGIGKSIEKKIKDFFETGNIKQIKTNNEKLNIFNELIKVHAIGPTKANELIEKHNIKSIEDLEKNIHLLNDKQVLGLKYVYDFEKKIPYDEMKKHDEYITNIAKLFNPNANISITGSYRRKSPDSGDIDVLVTSNFKEIIQSLINNKYIVDTFALGRKKFMGVCRLKENDNINRRLDILYTHEKEYPFALLYFTGNGNFNVKMRNIALSQGYSLSEYGIKYNTGENKGEFVENSFNSEKDIFDFLKMDYVEPENRI